MDHLRAGPSCTPQLRSKRGAAAEKHARRLWDPWAQRLGSMLLYLPEAHMVLLPVLLSFLPSQAIKMYFRGSAEPPPSSFPPHIHASTDL